MSSNQKGTTTRPAKKTELSADNCLDKLAKRINDLKSDNNDKGPIFIAIAGRAASGKSYLARELSSLFGERALCICADDYYLNLSDVQTCHDQLTNWDSPDVINIDLFNSHIRMLDQGKPISKPIYNMEKSLSTGEEIIYPKEIIIVEGAHTLNERFEIPSAINIFVHCEENKSLERRLNRDVVIRKKGTREHVEQYFRQIAVPAYSKHIEPTIDLADIIIFN